MKNKTRIRIDFNKAKKEADRLDGIAEKLQKYADSNLENSIKGLSSAWTGDNSRMFLKKEGMIKTKMLKTARDLRAVAADIRRIAKQIYDAEMQAYEVVATRRKK